MKIGIIGAGNVGGTLGTAFLKAGHQVVFGVLDPADPKVVELVQKTGATAALSTNIAPAVDVLLLATPWPATQAAVQNAGDLTGKIVLDVTNPVTPDLSHLDPANNFSAGEQVAAWAPGARVVKIFNTVGFPVMADPRFGGEQATLLYAGDDAEAKKVAAQLASEIGFAPQDIGPLTEARWLETFAMLWIRMALFHGFGTGFAFKLIRR
jgi:8-hydroxy-5-deazaflavin:NADPH oxidoreductase